MRVVLQEAKQLLTVDPDFFRLVDVFTSGSTIQLAYSVDQGEAVRQGFSQVRVTAFTEKEPVKLVTEVSDKSDGSEIVENILLYYQRLRETGKKNREKVILQYNSDFTKKLDNSKLRAIAHGSSGAQVLGRSIVAEPKRTAVSPVSGRNGLSRLGVPNRTAQYLALKMITEEATDPSSVTTVGKQILSVHDLIDGVRVLPKTSSRYMLEYLKAIISANAPVEARSDLTYSYTQSTTNIIDVLDEVRFPAKLSDLSELFFAFELLDSHGAPVNTVVKKIRTEREINAFRTPKVAPSVIVLKSQAPGRGILQVRQQDPVAKYVQVYKRVLSHSSAIENEKYVFVLESPLLYTDGLRPFEVEIDSSATTLFRVVSLGDQRVSGAEFTNAVMRPSLDVSKLLPETHKTSSRRFVHVSLTTRTVSQGIAVDIRSVPFDTVSVRVLKRDITANESDFTVLATLQTVSQRDVFTYIDADVINTRMYEYRCGLVFSDGTEDMQGSQVVEYVPLAKDLIDTKIQNVQVITDETNYDVKFDVSSNVIPTKLDDVKAALAKQDLLQYFTDDVLRERTKLQALLAHEIIRVNLTTGEKESFGILTEGGFSDIDLRAVNSVQPLAADNEYRYEVRTMIREPETMFSSFVKTSVDPPTKREFSFSPAKFLHPIALTKGDLTSDTTLKAHHAKSPFAFGNTGSVSELDISLIRPFPEIQSVSAGQVNVDVVEVTWKVSGNVSEIDHFLVAKSTLDGREVIGKCHPHQENQEFHFLHKLGRQDIGEVTYIVIPVMIDYTKGLEVVSNRIFIQPRESRFTDRPTRVLTGREPRSAR